jgi:trehalose/maltose hydrolase-like predicted phosphorylase
LADSTAPAAALDASHAAAWAQAYGTASGGGGGGGIELAGSPEFAARVNSSLYYLLCSVRSDWAQGISEGGIGSQAYRGMMFWSDGVMDGPLFAAINAPVADALLQYRLARLAAAESIARMNGFQGAYWPWQSAYTGFERSCGNDSIVMKSPQQKVRVGCYWMHEIHISADVALYFRLNYYRSGHNASFLKEIAWPVVSATADFFVSRANRSSGDPSKNWTMLNVIGPDEHSYITDSNTYTNAAAGQVAAFAAEAAATLGLSPPSLAAWEEMAGSMLVPTKQFCMGWSSPG